MSARALPSPTPIHSNFRRVPARLCQSALSPSVFSAVSTLLLPPTASTPYRGRSWAASGLLQGCGRKDTRIRRAGHGTERTRNRLAMSYVRLFPCRSCLPFTYQEDLLLSRVSQGYGCRLRPPFCMFSLLTKVCVVFYQTRNAAIVEGGYSPLSRLVLFSS